MSQDPYAGAHQHEREQRADVDPGPEQLQRQQPGCEAYRDAGVDRGEGRRMETRVYPTRPWPEQTRAGHWREDVGVSAHPDTENLALTPEPPISKGAANPPRADYPVP